MGNQAHRGVIRISPSLIKGLLLLPDDYEIETFHIDSLSNELRLYVSHPDIPETGEYQQLPAITPIYSVNYDEDGKRSAPFLSDIKVRTYPNYSKDELLERI